MNEVDARGDIALDVALRSGFEAIAKTLVKHQANVDLTDEAGVSLLLKAILRGAAKF